MIQNPSAYEEAHVLLDEISSILPKTLDGQEAIMDMKENNSANWRQMEWIGFWFEHFVETKVVPTMGGSRGPTFGRTTFDFKKNFVWDLKAHPMGDKNIILNDESAIRSCIEQFGGLGFIVVEGIAKYDDSESSFKKWHDNLKGGTSVYEKKRVERGAKSRSRKVSFQPYSVLAIWFENLEQIDHARALGTLKLFQVGMRNSNGKDRAAKYQLNLDLIPPENKLAKIYIQN